MNRLNKKLLALLLALASIGSVVGRGGGGGHGGGGFGGGHGGGFGGGGFHGGGGHFGGGGFSRGGGYSGGHISGGYTGRSTGFTSSYSRPSGIGSGHISSYSGGAGHINYTRTGQGTFARTGAGTVGYKGTGISHANYSRTGQGTFARTGTAGRTHTAGLAGRQTGLGASKGQVGQHATNINNASRSAGLNKASMNNRQHLTNAQSAAKQKFAGNKNLSGINKQNARNLVHNKGWNNFHRGPAGWNRGWWGAGWWPFGFWGWGWNWAWANGIWWWAGFPWYWWADYDPVYFQDTVYPAYVAQYEDVSGDQAPNYWDITNNTNNSITVTAHDGDADVQIAAGSKKRVFHAPGDNKFIVKTQAGTQEKTSAQTNVSIQQQDIAPAA